MRTCNTGIDEGFLSSKNYQNLNYTKFCRFCEKFEIHRFVKIADKNHIKENVNITFDVNDLNYWRVTFRCLVSEVGIRFDFKGAKIVGRIITSEDECPQNYALKLKYAQLLLDALELVVI